MFGGGDHWLIGQLQFLITLILSLTVHEWAHAWSALKLGDDTASRLGRSTLDPFVHIDPIGTFALPLLGVPFGWAKPVPINPGRFRQGVSLRSGLLLTAAAGPASNMCIAIGVTLCMALIYRIAPDLISGPRGYRPIFEQVIVLNVLLAFFNLLPVPPLDGSRILDTVVPDRLRAAWDQLAAYSPVALVVLLVVPPLVNLPVYDLPVRWASSLISVLVPADGGNSNGPSTAGRRVNGTVTIDVNQHTLPFFVAILQSGMHTRGEDNPGQTTCRVATEHGDGPSTASPLCATINWARSYAIDTFRKEWMVHRKLPTGVEPPITLRSKVPPRVGCSCGSLGVS